MTTIKLKKKPDDTQVKATKAPIRRSNAIQRDRSVPLPKASAAVKAEQPANQAPAKTGQRNHRFDGKAHGSPYSDEVAIAAKQPKPAGETVKKAGRFCS